MTGAREEILARIAAANRRAVPAAGQPAGHVLGEAAGPVPGSAAGQVPGSAAGQVPGSAAGQPAVPRPVPRRYRRSAGAPGRSPATLDLLAERLREYDATVLRCTPADVPSAVAGALRGSGTLVVPAGLDGTWLGLLRGVAVTVDDPGVTPARLDGTDAVLTGCRVAVAETGTVVLDAGQDQGRRAITLLPDRHVVVVRAEQVVTTVAEAVAVLAGAAASPQTWISGPSATSDIELVRVAGVHGPRDLRVVLVDA